MKKIYTLSFVLALLTSTNFQAQTILAQWNFNGPSATEVPGGTASPSTSEGTGTAVLVNGITATFASGVASGGSSDPVTTVPENFGWNTTTYAAQDTENKERGIQFNISTVGFSALVFKFDQRLSNTASNTWVVQYSTNGTTWTDAQLFTFEPAETGTGDVWYNDRTVDLSSVTALDNNPNASFRIVAAFDPTTNNYRAARSTSNYGPGGTSRFDMVTLTGTTLSTTNFNQNNFAMYPNPAKDFVQFSEVVNVEVYDVMGKKVFQAKEVEQINVSTLESGLYFVNINGVTTQKLMVK